MKRVIGLCVFVVVCAASGFASEPTWRSLWNGHDFTNWDTYLSKPDVSVKLADEVRNAKGEHVGAVGVNRDPTQVFTVVSLEGQPAIRISGQIFGVLVTRKSFSDYHLRVEMKWGDKKWPPRLERPRDSGILYHADGAWGSAGNWLPSLEFQVQQGDLGDFWAINSRALIRAKPIDAKEFIYDPKSELRMFAMGMPDYTRRVRKSEDFEKAFGEWNVLELVCLGSRSWHIVNGHVVLVTENAERKSGDAWVPAKAGRIQFQSEGAEVFYRRIELCRIEEFPRGLTEAVRR